MRTVIIHVATPEGTTPYIYECYTSAVLTAIVNGTYESLSEGQHIGLIEVL